MINYIDIARRLVGKNVKNDADMPPDYRQGGRPLHNDWGVWPFTRIPRMLTTFLLPMPSKKVAGNAEPIWTPYQDGYPLAPGTELRDLDYWDGTQTIKKPHFLTMHPVHPVGQWSEQAVWLDGEWRPCYSTSSRAIFGRRLYQNHGLKPDVTLNTFMWNFPEASLTFNKITEG